MRTLIVEDDTGIAGGLEATLRSVGYAVDVCSTLTDAGAALRVEAFDLVLLDLGLPDGDGIDWLRRLRQEGRTLPVIIMTARDALPDRVAGLDQGADDYLVKPFAPEELLARMRVALRRSEGRAAPLLHHGDLEVDPAAHTVRKAGTLVPLRAKEFALLLALLRANGQVLSRQRLEEALYGFDDALESNALEVHIHHLRRKLGSELLQTVRGVGYFVPRPDTGQADARATHSGPP
ncbi:MAG TPA: DNA-binding response regulator [Comamonadaceae bacterium]|nr:DNA-binding response regulator [Comamonadaceae bacterium]